MREALVIVIESDVSACNIGYPSLDGLRMMHSLSQKTASVGGDAKKTIRHHLLIFFNCLELISSVDIPRIDQSEYFEGALIEDFESQSVHIQQSK